MFASKWNGWLRRHVRRALVVVAVLFAMFAGSTPSRGQSVAARAAGSERWREHPVVARALAAAEREPSFAPTSASGAESLLPLSPAARLRAL